LESKEKVITFVKIKTMSIKAKFQCYFVTEYVNQKQAVLIPVYGTSEENKIFSKYTPSGKLEIMIDNETPASDYFKPGKEYYLTFEEAN
jgi:hypothetical protein